MSDNIQPFSCPICLEHDLDDERVSCPSCSEFICIPCFEEYCLSKDLDIFCFNTSCKFPWSEEFVDESSSSRFRNVRLRKHRTKIMVDQEIARLPALQERARIMKAALMVKKKHIPHYVSQVLESYGQPLSAHTISLLEPKEIAKVIKIFGNEFLTQSKSATTPQDNKPARLARRNIQDTLPYDTHDDVQTASTPQGKKPVIQARACHKLSCRGFLNSENICGICETRFCKDCQQSLTASGHVCDPAIVTTINLIAQETKPCPSCATAIFKIDGCDQMWCTQCQTPFSWFTGKKETSGVHNPHYYEWCRRNHRTIPRPDCEQGQLMEFHAPDDWGVHISDHCVSVFQQFHRQLREYIAYDLRPEEGNSMEDELAKLGVAYLSGKISSAEWEGRVYIQKRKAKRIQAQKDIIRVHVAAGTDIMNTFIVQGEIRAADTLKEMVELIDFTQKALDNCAERFSCSGNELRSVELHREYGLDKLIYRMLA